MTVWIPGEADGEAYKRHAPATLRNRDAILAVLGEALPSSGLVLEVASCVVRVRLALIEKY